jgi:hypothetical protein
MYILFAVILNGCVFSENNDGVANSGSIENPEKNDSAENVERENIIYFRGDIAIRSGGEYTYDTVIALDRSDNTFVLNFNMMSGFDVAKGTFVESETQFAVSGENGRAQFTLEKMPDGNCVVRGQEAFFYYLEDGCTMVKISKEQYDEITKFHAEWNAQNIGFGDDDSIVYFRSEIADKSSAEYIYDTVIALDRSDNTFVLNFEFDVAKGTFIESEYSFCVIAENNRAQFTLEKLINGNCVVYGKEAQNYHLEDGGNMLRLDKEQYDDIIKHHAE